MSIHTIFDVIAAASSLAVTWTVYAWRLRNQIDRTLDRVGRGYFLALIIGAVVGGYGFGTWNLYMGGVDGIGRSILGALAGAILAVEGYKAATGIRGSTGLVFVPAFTTSVSVGRIGCFLSGLTDQTHGVPSSLPWAVDLGDGVLRHPVQLYESADMIGFLIFFLIALQRRSKTVLQIGFYLMVAFYAGQRFLIEFLKPYETILGPLNLFHLVCLALIAYAAAMMGRMRNAGT